MTDSFPPYAIFSSFAILVKIGLIIRYRALISSYSVYFKLLFMCFLWLNIFELTSFYFPDANQPAYLLLVSYYVCLLVGIAMVTVISFSAAGLMSRGIGTFVTVTIAATIVLTIIPGYVLNGVKHIGFTITRIPGEQYWVFQISLMIFVISNLMALTYGATRCSDPCRRRKSKALLISLLPIFLLMPIVLLLMQADIPVTGTVFGSFAILLFLFTLTATEAEIMREPVSAQGDNRLFRFLSNIPITAEFKLANRVRRAVASKYSNDLEKAVAHYEKTLIQETLNLCEGNKTLAAKLLGVSRTTLRRKISAVDQNRLEASTGVEAPACDDSVPRS